MKVAWKLSNHDEQASITTSFTCCRRPGKPDASRSSITMTASSARVSSAWQRGIGILPSTLAIPVVPRRLGPIGLQLSLVGAVQAPAVPMVALVRQAHVLDDHAGLHPAIEATPHDLPVTAPQALNDLRVHDRCCADRLKHNGLKIGIHLVGPGHERRIAARPAKPICTVAASVILRH